jgi:hypothetical protein
MLIAEFDRREGWSDGGTQSCAHWLNWKCGIDMGAAREKVRTARCLVNDRSINAPKYYGLVVIHDDPCCSAVVILKRAQPRCTDI